MGLIGRGDDEAGATVWVDVVHRPRLKSGGQ